MKLNRNRLWFGLQLVITLGLLFLLFRTFNWATFLSLFGKIEPGYYLLFLALLTLAQFVYAFRWYLVLRALGSAVSYRKVVQQYFVALFFSNFLPTAIGGDVSKVYYLGQEQGYVTVGAAVFIDRFLGFFWMSLLGTFLLWWLNISITAFVVARDILTVGSIGFLLVFAAIVLFPLQDRLQEIACRNTLMRQPLGLIAKFLEHIRIAGHNPVLVVSALLTVVIYFLLTGLIYRTFFSLTTNVIVPQPALIAIQISMAIATNLPISVNGIGLREQLHYLLFANVGIPKEAAISISLIILFNFLIMSAVGYGLWLRMRVRAPLASGMAVPETNP
jgi:uncharacterized protein (TIRG00374 family)